MDKTSLQALLGQSNVQSNRLYDYCDACADIEVCSIKEHALEWQQQRLCNKCKKNFILKIDKKEDLDPVTFITDYLVRNKPVLLGPKATEGWDIWQWITGSEDCHTDLDIFLMKFGGEQKVPVTHCVSSDVRSLRKHRSSLHHASQRIS
eukprot:m.128105 g.128105  ORF g.128105 m.128105 type:complete len:149 (+) comp14557_c0_seq12:290-736(+)